MAIQFGPAKPPSKGAAKAVPASKAPKLAEPVKPARKGRPRLEEASKTNEAKKPWEALGMSRRTWYRRQAEKRPSPV